MKNHTNFYENIQEACMRLVNTVVMYDNRPYYVLCITDHKKDGIFRMYLDELYTERGAAISRTPGIPYEYNDGTPQHIERGKRMDNFLKDNPDCGIIRKNMDSPLFNRFRPFPLGMCNLNGEAYFLCRSPTRNTQQGLTENMIRVFSTSDTLSAGFPAPRVSLISYELARTLVGDYPEVSVCREKIVNSAIDNTSVAFNREFAFVRGPLDLVFLAYRQDVIGYVPNKDEEVLHLHNSFRHLKEVIEELGFFESVKTI